MTLQVGSYLTVNVNVSNVNDLFAWQVNMSWSPSILNATTITYGDGDIDWQDFYTFSAKYGEYA